MYFVTPETIASRQAALDGFHKASLALFNTAASYSETLIETGRKTIARRLGHFERVSNGNAGTPVGYLQTLWSDEAREDALALVRHHVEAVNSVHGTMTELVETHIGSFRRYVTDWVEHVANLTPPEGVIALNAMKSAMVSASTALNGLAEAGHQVVESAEKEIEQIADEVAATPKAADTRAKKAN